MTNILFVCIGNSCRSQMAEGFARKYGADVMRAWSAGLAPASIVQSLTVQVMDQRNVDIRDQFPKSVDELELNAFDSVVNMSGFPMPTQVRGEVRIWDIVDPMTQSEEIYIKVRDQIEGLVMQMVLDLRLAAARPALVTPSATPRPPVRPAPTNRVAPAKIEVDRTSDSSQRFGFGRVRRSRDKN